MWGGGIKENFFESESKPGETGACTNGDVTTHLPEYTHKTQLHGELQTHGILGVAPPLLTSAVEVEVGGKGGIASRVGEVGKNVRHAQGL